MIQFCVFRRTSACHNMYSLVFVKPLELISGITYLVNFEQVFASIDRGFKRVQIIAGATPAKAQHMIFSCCFFSAASLSSMLHN